VTCLSGSHASDGATYSAQLTKVKLTGLFGKKTLVTHAENHINQSGRFQDPSNQSGFSFLSHPVQQVT